MSASVDVILPVLDEREALPGVLGGMPAGYRAIVVDNGSTDGSGDVARSCGAMVVEEPRRGFGAACFAGLQAASADVVAFMDCDGSFDPAELPLVCRPVLGRARPVLGLGARTGSWRAFPPHLRLANRVLVRELSRKLGGVTLRDLGPMRAARREPLLALGIEDRRFGWPLEMVVRAAQAGWVLEEVSVSYAPRIGRSKVTGTVRGTARAVKDMRAVLATL